MEAVREDVELGILPGYDLPVVPDPSITLIEGGRGHRLFSLHADLVATGVV